MTSFFSQSFSIGQAKLQFHFKFQNRLVKSGKLFQKLLSILMQNHLFKQFQEHFISKHSFQKHLHILHQILLINTVILKHQHLTQLVKLLLIKALFSLNVLLSTIHEQHLPNKALAFLQSLGKLQSSSRHKEFLKNNS